MAFPGDSLQCVGDPRTGDGLRFFLGFHPCLPGRMSVDFLQGKFEEGFSRFHAMPGGCAGGMRQGDKVHRAGGEGDAKFASNGVAERGIG